MGVPTINLGDNGGTPQMIAPWNNGENLYSVRDDLSWIHGSHTVKAGVFLGFNRKFEYNGGGSSERLRRTQQIATFAWQQIQLWQQEYPWPTGSFREHVQ